MATHEGILYKLGEKGLIKTWKSRYFEMRDGFMYYYKHKGESEIGRIDLNQAIEVVLNTQNKGKGTFGFEIKTYDRTWVLCADSLESAGNWTSVIGKVIKKDTKTSTSTESTNSLQPNRISRTGPPPLPITRTEESNPISPIICSVAPPPVLPKPDKKDPPPRPLKPAPDLDSYRDDQRRPVPVMPVKKGPVKYGPKKMLVKKMSPKGSPKKFVNTLSSGNLLSSPVKTPMRPPSPQPQPQTPEPTQEKLSPEQQRADNRAKAAAEILSTEQYYVECLLTIQKDYMDQFLNSLRNKDKDVTYTENDIKSLFSVNLSMIIPINCELQQSLEQKMKTWNDQTSIGESFIKVAPFFKMYLDYSNNYTAANDLFKKLIKEEKFTQKMNGFRENARVKLQLEHLLIMPVQRIPRYILLLTELLKYTPQDHVDQANLNKALSLMQEVANHINNSMKRIDSYDKAANYPELVLPHRHLIWEGFIEARYEKSKGEIKFVLFNDLLLHIPKSTPKFNKAHTLPEHQVNLILVWTGQTTTVPSGETTAEIFIPKKTYHISYNNPEEKEFYKLLQNAIAQVCGSDPPPLERQGEHDFTDCIYSGHWSGGHMQGEGIMTYNNISQYTGTWEVDNKSGYGTMTWKTGHVYEGYWKYNVMNGEGEYRWPNGDVYVGNMVDGKRSGNGSLTYGNGGHYEGEWAFDRPSGFGKFISDQAQYEGEWLDGLFNGDGEYNDKLAVKFYKGTWVKGLREGKGHCTIGTGYTYNGDWKAGKKHGYGTLQIVVNEGVEMYQGGWVADVKEGQGVYNYFDGSIYEGSWKDDMKHGSGKFTFYEKDISGRKLYEGEFSQDKMCGKGTLYFKSGEKFCGHFKENTFHGTGRLELNDIVLLEGKWSSGILEGKGSLVLNLPNTKKPVSTSGSFEAGMFTSSSNKFDVPIASGTSVINLPQI